MSEEKNNSASANDQNAGSADEFIGGPANVDIAGESSIGDQSTGNVDLSNYIEKSQYEELESKLGTQGNELGEMRDFFEQVSPLLNKLDESPELINAILEDKIDINLVKAAAEGKVTVDDEKVVTEAHKEIKKELGDKKYEKSTPEEIEKLISEKLGDYDKKLENLSKDFKKSLDESEEKRIFEQNTFDFVNATPDFETYAEGITEWFKENPTQDNIKIAYDAVKGAALQKKYENDEKVQAGEEAKNIAANAGGGSSQGTGNVEQENAADNFIGNNSNPNLF